MEVRCVSIVANFAVISYSHRQSRVTREGCIGGEAYCLFFKEDLTPDVRIENRLQSRSVVTGDLIPGQLMCDVDAEI